MASAVVGALRVNLSADTAAFSSGLKQASGGLTSFSATHKKAMLAVTAAITAVTAAITYGIKKSINEFDNLAKTSQKIGIPVEELSRLKHAADLSGVAMGTLETGLQRLSRNLVDVAQGSGAEARRAFETLGVAVKNTDGSLKSSTQIMQEVAGRFAGMEDGATKTALAMQLFGRAGAELIPMLNAGEAGLAAMMHEADQLGLVIDTKTAKAAERFNDNLTRLGRVKDGIIIQLTAHMLPALERLSQHLIDAAMNSGWVSKALDGLKFAFDGVTRAVILVWDNLTILTRIAVSFIAVKLASAAVTAGIAFIKFGAAIRAVGIMLASLNIIKMATSKGFLLQAALIAALVNQWDNLKDTVESFVGQISELLPEGVMGSVSTALKGLGLDTRGLEMDLNSLSIEAGDHVPAALEQLNLAIDDTKEKKKALREAEKEHNALMAEGKRLMESLRTPQEELAASIDRINMLYRAGAIDAETYQRAMRDAAERSAFDWASASQSIISSFQAIAQNFGQVSNKIGKAGQAFAIVQAFINAYQAASKALATYPPPFSYIAAAAALAQGLSYVASIKAQKVPSFATGGSFMVGGKGGIDQNRVMMDVSRGERVTIETPEQQRGNGQIETIRLVSDLDSVYTFDHIRKLVRRLNEYGRDNGMPRLELVPI